VSRWHQDVKPGNILVVSGGLGSAYKWLGDFNGVRAFINNRVARSPTSLWTIWQAQFSDLPGLSYLIRRTGSLSLKRLLALSICFASPVLADVPGSGSNDSNWHNISSLIKHMDQVRKYS
jgi:hypothetical protein